MRKGPTTHENGNLHEKDSMIKIPREKLHGKISMGTPYSQTGDGENRTHAIILAKREGDSMRGVNSLTHITPKPQTPKTPTTRREW